MTGLSIKLRSRVEQLTGGASATPLFILFGLNFVDELDRLAFSTFTPEIRDAFGLSDSGIVTVNIMTQAVLLFAAVPLGIIGDKFSRIRLVMGAALVWASMSVFTGLARGVGMLVAIRILAGIGRLANEIIHPSLLTDFYEPDVQPRIFAIHRIANPMASINGVVAAAIAIGLGSWRPVFFIFAIPTVLLVIGASRLQEPARRAGAKSGFAEAFSGTSDHDAPPVDDTRSRGERLAAGWRNLTIRQLWAIRTLRWQWIALFVLGLAIVAIPTFTTLYLERVFSVGMLGRGLEKWMGGIGSVIGLGLSGWFSSRVTGRGRHDLLAIVVAVSAAAYAVSFMLLGLVPDLWMAFVLLFLTAIVGTAFMPAYYPLVGMVTPPKLKTASFGWGVMFIAVGVVGGVFIAKYAENQGYRSAFMLLGGIMLAASIAAWYSARFVLDDIAAIEAGDDGDEPQAELASVPVEQV